VHHLVLQLQDRVMAHIRVNVNVMFMQSDVLALLHIARTGLYHDKIPCPFVDFIRD